VSVYDDGWKTCPECAEPVRSAARKCRFCGWRFDGGRSGGRGLRSLLRSSPTAFDLPSLLENWGTPLERDEQVAFFLLARARDTNGFLLVTDMQVCFFAKPVSGLLSRNSTDTELLFSHPVGMLAGVSTVGSRRKPALRLLGRGEELLLSGVAPRSRLAEVARYLQACQGRA
jgi:hypothetical protein